MDGQVGVLALGGAGALDACIAGGEGDLADGMSVNVVPNGDEVVGMPLRKS